MAFTKQETQEWWREVVNDKDRLNSWLQKLYKTELGGYTDHMGFLQKQGADIQERTALILTNVALDELKHANIIHRLLNDRGVCLGEPVESKYWKIVNEDVKTVEQYCAVNHYGEDLAAFRFEIIQQMPETPQDIKAALDVVLPDEVFHRITLHKLAGEQALSDMKQAHDRAISALKGN